MSGVVSQPQTESDAIAEVVRCAKGLVLTALPSIADEGVVVPEWWQALSSALVQLAVVQDES